MESRKHRELSNHPCVVTIAVMASIVGILSGCLYILGFLSGNDSIPKMLNANPPAPLTRLLDAPSTSIAMATPVVATPMPPTKAPPTVTSPKPPSTVIPLSPSPIAQPSSTLPPCPQGDLTGRVASDIPGTQICLGANVASLVDSKTKPRDVYAIDIAKGQPMILRTIARLPARRDSLITVLYYPGTKSLADNLDSWLGGAFPANDYRQTYFRGSDSIATQAGMSGTYYVVVVALATDVEYTLTVTSQ